MSAMYLATVAGAKHAFAIKLPESLACSIIGSNRPGDTAFRWLPVDLEIFSNSKDKSLAKVVEQLMQLFDCYQPMWEEELLSYGRTIPGPVIQVFDGKEVGLTIVGASFESIDAYIISMWNDLQLVSKERDELNRKLQNQTAIRAPYDAVSKTYRAGRIDKSLTEIRLISTVAEYRNSGTIGRSFVPINGDVLMSMEPAELRALADAIEHRGKQ